MHRADGNRPLLMKGQSRISSLSNGSSIAVTVSSEGCASLNDFARLSGQH